MAFTWEDVELINSLVTASPAGFNKDKLRELSLKMGMEILSERHAVANKMTAKKALDYFRRRTKRLREIKGWTQEELASKLNVTKNSVYLYEAGKNLPTLDRTIQICLVLDTNPNYLFGWEKNAVGEAVEDLMEAMSQNGP